MYRQKIAPVVAFLSGLPVTIFIGTMGVAQVVGQLLNGADVTAACPGCEFTHLHIFDHALT